MLKKARNQALASVIALVFALGGFVVLANPMVPVQQIPVAQAHNPTTVDVNVDCNGWTADVGYADFSDGHYMETTITGAGEQPIVEKSDALNGNGTLHYSGSLSGDGPFDIVVSAQAKYPNGKDEGKPVVGEGKHEAGCNPPTPTPSPTPTPTPKPTATPTSAPTSTPTHKPSHTPKPTLPPTDATIPSGTNTPGLPVVGGLSLASMVGALLFTRRQRKNTGR